MEQHHPWVAPLLSNGMPIPGQLGELAGQASAAAAVVGYDVANARAHEATQGFATDSYAQGEFYQRLIGESMMMMHRQQMHAAAASAARGHPAAAAQAQAPAAAARSRSRASFLLWGP